MTSHELAKILLENEDLPVSTHVHNHEFFSEDDCMGTLHVALAYHYTGNHIMIGNMYRKNLNSPNWYIIKSIVGELREDMK